MLKPPSKPTRFFDFNILTALKGWVGQAAKRTGALHIIIFILKLKDYILIISSYLYMFYLAIA